ncbi:FkbM family methyltransferase [Rhabdaerophilum sp. SD176]|uniref:FkbM family methyltransferase n=1 Tax=Rhabdaerophilum sp. SD176 TaxID=2983548 RepID=UPI0024DF931B|nr:FkbM family methyltransferase [Rhabdaerophilum sp. SD176]
MDQERDDQFTTVLAQQAYRLVLGRPVEAAHLHAMIEAKPDGLSLLGHLLRSEEFLLDRAQRLGSVIVPSRADLDLIRSIPRYMGPGEPGFVRDFLGIRTDVRFVNAIVGLSGAVEGYPIPHGNFHGDLDEWCGLIDAMEHVSGSLVAMELGMGWGPWLVAAATIARKRGIEAIRLVGVEASQDHLDFAHAHCANNGIDREMTRLIHAAITSADGAVEFPVADDPAEDWGMAAFRQGESTGHDYRGHLVRQTEIVTGLSIATLLAEETRVDLLHVDIQGHEAECIGAAIEPISEKVASLIVGTHGRAIEDALMSCLGDAGWKLVREKPCQFRLDDGRPTLLVDGCQVWKNPRLRA